jgi:hypothetical protein
MAMMAEAPPPFSSSLRFFIISVLLAMSMAGSADSSRKP